MTQLIPSKIAGIFKFPEAKPVMKTMTSGMDMAFKREPENPHDPNAIAIYAVPMKIESAPEDINHPFGLPIKCGYVPKEIAAKLKNAEILKIQKGVNFDMVTITIA